MVSIDNLLAMIIDDKKTSSEISESSYMDYWSDSDSSRRKYSHGCSSCGYCSSCYERGEDPDSWGSLNDFNEVENEPKGTNFKEIANKSKMAKFKGITNEPKMAKIKGITDEIYWNNYFSESQQFSKISKLVRKFKQFKVSLKKSKIKPKSRRTKIKYFVHKKMKVRKIDYLSGWY